MFSIQAFLSLGTQLTTQLLTASYRSTQGTLPNKKLMIKIISQQIGHPLRYKKRDKRRIARKKDISATRRRNHLKEKDLRER